MTNLKSVNVGMNRFCGPAVLSILTGLDTDECANEIKKVNGSYDVAGVNIYDLMKAAERLGYSTRAVQTARSLFGTLTILSHTDGMYVIMVTGHFVCVEVQNRKIFFCDNHTREPIPAASSARLTQEVLGCYLVTKVRELPKKVVPTLISESIEVQIMDNTIYCDRIKVFSNGVTSKEPIGSIRAKDNTELQGILERLEAYVEH